MDCEPTSSRVTLDVLLHLLYFAAELPPTSIKKEPTSY
jgi:hypothetical protein